MIVVDKLEAGDGKTKATAEMLKRLGATGKTLVIDVKPDEEFALSARNIAGVQLVPSGARDGARRHGHGARHRDARGAREAAGSLGSCTPLQGTTLAAGSWKLT